MCVCVCVEGLCVSVWGVCVGVCGGSVCVCVEGVGCVEGVCVWGVVGYSSKLVTLLRQCN